LKLTVLLALTTAARAHELAALDLSCALMKPDTCRFTITIHVKNARPCHPPKQIVLHKYNQNPAVCAVQCLNQYLTSTKSLHPRKSTVSIICEAT
jgi:integrase